MPRIEIIPAGWEESREKARGDGSPTEDVCASCASEFTEGEPLDQGCPDKLTRQYPGATIGSTDVEHPDFEGEGYHCALCNCELGEDDN